MLIGGISPAYLNATPGNHANYFAIISSGKINSNGTNDGWVYGM